MTIGWKHISLDTRTKKHCQVHCLCNAGQKMIGYCRFQTIKNKYFCKNTPKICVVWKKLFKTICKWCLFEKLCSYSIRCLLIRFKISKIVLKCLSWYLKKDYKKNLKNIFKMESSFKIIMYICSNIPKSRFKIWSKRTVLNYKI